MKKTIDLNPWNLFMISQQVIDSMNSIKKIVICFATKPSAVKGTAEVESSLTKDSVQNADDPRVYFITEFV